MLGFSFEGVMKCAGFPPMCGAFERYAMRHRIPVLLGALLTVFLWRPGLASAEVKLGVLNPRGEATPPPAKGLQPRLASLDGKRIALLENGKMGAREFQDALEGLLKQRYPNVTVLRIPKPEGSRFAFDAKDWYPEVARRADAFAYGMGD